MAGVGRLGVEGRGLVLICRPDPSLGRAESAPWKGKGPRALALVVPVNRSCPRDREDAGARFLIVAPLDVVDRLPSITDAALTKNIQQLAGRHCGKLNLLLQASDAANDFRRNDPRRLVKASACVDLIQV